MTQRRFGLRLRELATLDGARERALQISPAALQQLVVDLARHHLAAGPRQDFHDTAAHLTHTDDTDCLKSHDEVPPGWAEFQLTSNESARVTSQFPPPGPRLRRRP